MVIASCCLFYLVRPCLAPASAELDPQQTRLFGSMVGLENPPSLEGRQGMGTPREVERDLNSHHSWHQLGSSNDRVLPPPLVVKQPSVAHRPGIKKSKRPSAQRMVTPMRENTPLSIRLDGWGRMRDGHV